MIRTSIELMVKEKRRTNNLNLYAYYFNVVDERLIVFRLSKAFSIADDLLQWNYRLYSDSYGEIISEVISDG